ncbi:DinB family protein [Galbibacter sp. EGI 63066]|uniref:DinB family protein n=1 Tax=Galbibacter sp. EGI 63066 TaxID=2993559 RepID=UPI0022498EE3|nr:DinB family protein [Galbibacter sp. EGI 63066]MCX2679570.1 DinB family protein [Galbibacter sp. EGI 63066]
MKATEIILLNFSEIRRRSIKLWSGIPNEYLHWKPDEEAMSIIEMIRHVLEGEHLFHKIIQNRGDLGAYKSPWDGLEYKDLQHEMDFAESYHNDFLEMIAKLNEEDLKHVIIDRKEVGQRKKLGDYLNRMAYHEAVHTGQMLDYLRSAGVNCPKIWD